MESSRTRFQMTLADGRGISLGERTLLMGIVNVTPDSFSDGGRFCDRDSAVAHAERLLDEGADMLDFGGESTRPGAAPVPADEQIRRVAPVVAKVRQRRPYAVISVDTASASVAEAAFDAGADILNDVTALRGDPGMARLAAERGVPVVLMHMLGEPRTMQQSPRYGDVVADIVRFLAERISAATETGIEEGRIMVDPGFGFGKTLEHNLALLRRLGEFHALGRPLAVGTSRKSMIGQLTGKAADGRAFGTAATVAAAVARGAHVVRVHDVAAMADVVRVADALERGAA